MTSRARQALLLMAIVYDAGCKSHGTAKDGGDGASTNPGDAAVEMTSTADAATLDVHDAADASVSDVPLADGVDSPADRADAGDAADAEDVAPDAAPDAARVVSVRCFSQPVCTLDNNHCCAARSGCYPLDASCQNPPIIICDEAADCPAGQVCCLASGATSASVSCSDTCGPAPQATFWQICAPGNSGECLSGTCQPSNAPYLPSDYWTCQ